MMEVVWCILSFAVGILIGAGISVHNVNKTRVLIEKMQQETHESWWKLVQSFEEEVKKIEQKISNMKNKGVN